jgi:biopolymer transport protein ExbD
VENELKTRKAADPELALNLNADDAVQYGIVAKVMSSIERAGVTKLAVLTAPQ